MHPQERNQHQETLETSNKTRRRALNVLLSTAGAVAIANTGIGSIEVHAATNGVVSLPLTIDNAQSFEVFLRAIDDQRVRAGLEAQQSALPKNVSDIVRMVDDSSFKELATVSYTKYINFQHGKATNDEVLQSAQQLHTYIVGRYPTGVDSLRKYMSIMNPQYRQLEAQAQTVDGKLNPNAASTSVAANAVAVANVGGVVNAAVWANVAVATAAVVAAAAVVVVAIVVD